MTPYPSNMDLLQKSYSYGTSPLTNSSSQPLHVYLFGASITQSLSPLIAHILFRALHAKWTYNLHQTTSPAEFTAKLNEETYIGGSITMPNKLTFMDCLDDITDEARVIGAVNTSFIRLDDARRRHIGTNTDCIGIWETIIHRNPDDRYTARGKPALVIGAGGAARSAVYALWTWFGASEIYVVNRLQSEVDTMITSFRSNIPDIKIRYIPSVEYLEGISMPYLIVGTIPDYPPKEEGEIRCWRITEAILKKQTGVLLDMCYMPSPVTTLLKMGKTYGWAVISGAEVLVQVCVAQQILWLEREAVPEAVEEALEAVRVRVEARL